jgi:hypothetical protein
MMEQDPNNYWEQLERLEKLIRASELKAGVIFSFHSLILGLFADRFAYLQPIFQDSILHIILVVLWIISVAISIFYCFKCFTPRIETKYKKNVFFFKDAASAFGNIKDYSEKLMDVCSSKKEFYMLLSNQIHIESIIISKKFDSVQKSIKFFAFSFVLILLMFLIWALSNLV